MVDAFRLGHQPDAQLGHDAEVGLAEQAVEERPDAVREQVGGTRVGIMAEAGVEYLAAGQHHLHPGDMLQPVAVRRMTEAALENIADEAGVGAGAGAVDLQRNAARVQVVGQLLLGDAGLDYRVRQLGIDQDDAVHARQIEHHLAIGNCAGVAVAPVLAGADRIDGSVVGARQRHQRDDVGARAGADHRQRQRAARGSAARIAVQGGGIALHVGGADCRAHRPQQRRAAAAIVSVLFNVLFSHRALLQLRPARSRPVRPGSSLAEKK